MSVLKTWNEAKTLSLADLNQHSWAHESALGPLVAIGNDGATTTLTYDAAQDAPTAASVIRVVPPPGAAGIDGAVFVAGVLTTCTVDRG